MNSTRHLTGFFEKASIDHTVLPTHVSLYVVLFQFWCLNNFKNPISISREEIMPTAKIGSKATYHKCMRELHQNGYIKYEPSFNPFKGSYVHLFSFSDNLNT
jgi:hypothetical protein